MKALGIGCGIVALLLAIAVGAAVWYAPTVIKMVNEAMAQEEERQRIAEAWTPPEKDAADDAIFPAALDEYRRETVDGDATIADLQIDVPGRHAVYRNAASRLDIYLYHVSHLETEALFKRVEENGKKGSGMHTWVKIDLGDAYARIYLSSDRLKQNHLWYTRGRLIVLRTTDAEDREPAIKAFFQTPPPDAAVDLKNADDDKKLP